MRRALELARRGRGMTHPNPLVGAVVVRDGRIVGEGYHEAYGGPHAEVNALRAAGGAARGAELYVTLEPCAHHGKTPPCVDAIVAAGIARVTYAAEDMDADAAGGSVRLRAAGVEVRAGIERDAARSLNHAFFRVRERGGPYIALKLAQSLDGGIAGAPGERTQLTGEEAQHETHRLRAEHDAILIGIRTALVDDPLLTVRGVPCRVPPARVVLDSQARLPASAQLFRTLDEAPVHVVCSEHAPADRVRALEAAGATVLRAPAGHDGLDPVAVRGVLGGHGLGRILIEGGGRVATAFADAGLVDRLHLLLAPVLLGAAAVPGLRVGTGSRWRPVSVQQLGADVLLTLDPVAVPAAVS